MSCTNERPAVTPNARYGTGAIARLLGCSPNSVRNWWRDGRLACHTNLNGRYSTGTQITDYWNRYGIYR